VSEYEARAVPLIMSAIAQVPKELAQLMAQYARVAVRNRTIAGQLGQGGDADGPAVGGATFTSPGAIVLDTTDPLAGPQLFIGQLNGLIRCLNMRTQMVSTIAGVVAVNAPPADGPARGACLGRVRSVLVAPHGGLLMCDQQGYMRAVSALPNGPLRGEHQRAHRPRGW
jgi:hypothetical protein